MKKVFVVWLLLLALLANAAGQGEPTLKSRKPSPDDAVSAAQSGGLEDRLTDLSRQISRELGENQKRIIAVVEFVDLKGNVTDFGRFLAEELITRLYQTRKFKVIERQLLNKVVIEQKLSLTGIIDQTSAQKLGRLLGVDAIASGTVTDLGKILRVNARLIDTGTAEIFAVASTDIAKEESVLNLVGAEVSQSSPSGPTSGTSTAANKEPLQKIEKEFYTFELAYCRRSGTSVGCEVRITNNERDREVRLADYDFALPQLFDDLGNRYASSEFQIADREGRQIWLISGVTTKIKLYFSDVSPQATKIVLLKLPIGQSKGMVATGFDVEFRNVPLK